MIYDEYLNNLLLLIEIPLALMGVLAQPITIITLDAIKEPGHDGTSGKRGEIRSF